MRAHRGDRARPHAKRADAPRCGLWHRQASRLLRGRFACEGVDLDTGLLHVARERLGDVPLHEGDVRSLALGRSFDIVTFLFSSIGLVRDLAGLHAAARSLAAHVADGGLLIVEPWLTPDVWRPGRSHALVANAEGLALTLVTVTGQKGNVSTAEMHYTLGTPDGVEQWQECHELGLFTDEEMRTALAATGLAVEHDPEGLIGRGLWFATR
jgi:hypothetical protein